MHRDKPKCLIFLSVSVRVTWLYLMLHRFMIDAAESINVSLITAYQIKCGCFMLSPSEQTEVSDFINSAQG